eukprot:maker-scaffold_33-snap-gene-2.3-mRNA-1 protein AED:0.03 eAED:0.03 QI:4/1/1/1/1/1/2/1195/66
MPDWVQSVWDYRRITNVAILTARIPQYIEPMNRMNTNCSEGYSKLSNINLHKMIHLPSSTFVKLNY